MRGGYLCILRSYLGVGRVDWYALVLSSHFAQSLEKYWYITDSLVSLNSHHDDLPNLTYATGFVYLFLMKIWFLAGRNLFLFIYKDVQCMAKQRNVRTMICKTSLLGTWRHIVWFFPGFWLVRALISPPFSLESKRQNIELWIITSVHMIK